MSLRPCIVEAWADPRYEIVSPRRHRGAHPCLRPMRRPLDLHARTGWTGLVSLPFCKAVRQPDACLPTMRHWIAGSKREDGGNGLSGLWSETTGLSERQARPARRTQGPLRLRPVAGHQWHPVGARQTTWQRANAYCRACSRRDRPARLTTWISCQGARVATPHVVSRAPRTTRKPLNSMESR